ncbi:response regulator transcription factor [Bacillaceae bacterium]
MKAKILVVDDDPKITTMLKRALIFEGYEVEVAADGKEALEKALRFDPQLVVLDVMLPKLDGWEVCRRLHEAGGTKILLLTAKDEVEDRVKGLDLGADDYLVKPFALEELFARIRALLRRGQEGTAEKELRFADLVLDPETREVYRGTRRLHLTTKEYELLLLFMRHPKKVLTREAIMEQVWGFDYQGESNVLEVYIAMLRQKLEEAGEPRLIRTVRGAGYVLRSD